MGVNLRNPSPAARRARTLPRWVGRLDRAASRLARPSSAVQQQSGVLDLLAHRLRQALPRGVAGKATARAALQERLQRAAAARSADAHRRCDAAALRLDALDPRRVLARGFAWLTDDADRAIMSVRSVSPGQSIRAVVEF